MPLEIEAKFKVPDHVAIRQRLSSVGAKPVGVFREVNTFFDTTDCALVKQDRGLRLRHNHDTRADRDEFIITYKGPRQPGELKTREEIEVSVTDGDEAAALLRAIGFAPTLSFEKRRESWRLGDCKVELDELPHLGMFVEIEGPSPASVESARTQLRLESLPVITEGYSSMLTKFLDEHRIATRSVMFGDSHA